MLVLTFVLAFLVRLISLGQSLWLDEATTARVVQQFNLSQILTIFSPQDFHPPLFYFVIKAWTSVFGYSEISLRMPSVIFSLLAGWFVYLIAKELKDRGVGVWAAAFFLFNPLIIYYSQEARMYMMVTFLLTAALYYFICLERDKGKKFTLLFLTNILIALSFVTFYGSIFFIATLYLYLIYRKQFQTLIFLLPGFVLSLFVISPLLWHQYVHSKEALLIVLNWKSVLGTVTLKNLFLIPLKFAIGRISWTPKILYYGIGSLWTLSLLFVIAKRSKEKDLLIFLLVVPIVLGIIFSLFSPLLQYFRFLYLLPIVCILLALGSDIRTSRIVLVGFIILSFIYLFLPQFHREDWKDLAARLPKDKPIYIITSSSDPLHYYDPNVQLKDLRLVSSAQEKSLVVIPYTADIYGLSYSQILLEKHYKKASETLLQGVSFETWAK